MQIANSNGYRNYIENYSSKETSAFSELFVIVAVDEVKLQNVNILLQLFL